MADDEKDGQEAVSLLHNTKEGDKRNPEQENTFLRGIHKFVQGETTVGLFYEDSMTLLIWLTIFFYIMVSVPEYEEYRTQADICGVIAASLAALEWLARLISSGENEKLGRSHLNFLMSAFSVFDLITIVPYLVLVLQDWGSHRELHGVQFLRVLRLFQRYNEGKGCAEALKVVSGVVSSSKWLLFSTAYFLFAIWCMVAACYHIAERNNPEVGDRFDNFLNCMWWSLINLMGEYPLNQEFTAWGKVIGTITMVIAIGGVHGIPTGIICDGYAKLATEDRALADNEEEDDEDNEDLLPIVTLELKESGIKGLDTEVGIEQCYLFCNGYTDAGRVFEGSIMLLVIVNVTATVLDTVESIHEDQSFHDFYKYLEPVSVGIFTLEYLVRFYAMGAHKSYPGFWRFKWALTNFYPLVDLLAIVPFYVDLIMGDDNIIPTTFVRVLRLFRIFRIFKAGKFVEGLNVFYAVLMDKASLLSMLLYAVAILWIFFSVCMYYTERHNPITKIADQFNTIPRAMWVTLLNFTGEYPLADYTTMGKIVSTFVAFIAIGIFGIPVAIFSDGISDKFEKLDELKRENEAEEEEEEAEEDPQELQKTAHETNVGTLWLFMQGQDLQVGDTTEDNPWWEVWGVRFEFGILTLICVNTLMFICSTVEDIEATAYADVYKYTEAASVIIYTTEYLLRCIASFGNPKLAGAWYAPLYPLGFVFSFLGLIDACAIVPWYVALIGNTSHNHWTILRTLRLVRLLKVERYLPSFSLFQQVLKEKQHSLLASVFIMCILTLFFSTLLHETEKNNKEVEGVTKYANAYRFRSVPSSFFYTFIHLTGDYPLMKYTPWGRFINFFMILLAQGLVGIPLGIIVDGFQSVMEERIEAAEELRQSWFDPEIKKDDVDKGEVKQDEKQMNSAPGSDNVGSGSGMLPVQPLLQHSSYGSCGGGCAPKRKSRSKRRDAWVVEGLSYGSVEDALEEGHGVSSRPNSGVGAGSTSMASGHVLEFSLYGSERQRIYFAALNYSPIFDIIQLGMITIAMVCIAVHTNTDWNDSTFGSVMKYVQIVTASFFLIEYLLRMYSCPSDPKFRGSHAEYTGTTWKEWHDYPYFCYATDFVGIVDLLAWLPFFVSLGFSDGSDASVVLRMMQVLVVLKWDRKLPAFTLLDDVLTSGESGRLLLCTMALSMILWVIFAALLYIIEENRPEQDGSFKNMPSSLFITMILIGGEWCRVDLEVPWGQLVGFVLALVGIGIIGIPVAVFFDGYSEIAEEYVEKYIAPPQDDVEEDQEESTEATESTDKGNPDDSADSKEGKTG